MSDHLTLKSDYPNGYWYESSYDPAKPELKISSRKAVVAKIAEHLLEASPGYYMVHIIEDTKHDMHGSKDTVAIRMVPFNEDGALTL